MSEPTSPRPYTFSHRPDIQGLRGIAVTLVVLYHAHVFLTGGYIGVDVFFVISGFVIAAGIFRELEKKGGTFSFRSFYQRRIQRLLPSLSVTVCLTLLTGIAFSPYINLKLLGRTGLAATFFNANHYLLRSSDYFAPTAERNALLHTWSLSVEEQFYFVFPLIFVLSATYALRRGKHLYWTVSALMGVIFVISLGAELYFSYTPEMWFGLDLKSVAFFGAPLRAWEFGVGVILAAALPWMQTKTAPRLRMGLLALGIGLIGLTAVLYTPRTLFPGIAAIVPVVGTMCVLIAGSLNAPSPLPLVSHRAVTRVGDLSYGWYLWHWPPLVFVQATWPGDPFIPMVCTMALSLGLAWLNERWIEQPIRHAAWLKRKYASLVLLALCLGAPVVAFGAMKVIIKQLDKDPGLQEMRARGKAYKSLGCRDKTYDVNQEHCRWGTKGAPWRVVLLGDSNAQQFIPVLSELVPTMGGEFHSVTLAACPFTDLNYKHMGSPTEGCVKWMRDSLVALEQNPPDLLLLSSAYDVFLHHPNWSIDDPETGITHRTKADRKAITQATSAQLITRLKKTIPKIAFIKAIPKFDRPTYDNEASVVFGVNCSILALKMFPEKCNISRPVKQSAQKRWNDAEDGRAGYINVLEKGDVQEIVVDDVLCPKNTCQTKDDKGWIYQDSRHITPYGSRLTRPVFEKFINAQELPNKK